MGRDFSIKKYILKLFKFFLKLYQKVFSPLLHAFSLSTVGGGCRFYPSCSEYSKQALDKYGLSVKTY